jgi:hypothetical protein
MSNVTAMGLELARAFYREAVAPIVARVAPELRYTAGRLGPRSDALGFDDAISRDHGWGPGCTLLIEPARFAEIAGRLDVALRNELPVRFAGYPTSYRGMHLVAVDHPPIDHDVEISTPERFLHHHLGTAAPTTRDWLAIDEQKLLEVTGGELFRDDLAFAATRAALAFYPEPLRLHLMAVEWQRIADEQAFPARAGSRGDEVGSAIVAARLAESAMRLGFYLDRVYPPYAKWLGTAFRRLPSAAELHPPILALVTAATWQERDRCWAEVVRGLITLHERGGLVEPGRYRPGPIYNGRPGTGLPHLASPTIGELVDELCKQIAEPEVAALPRRLGSLNQLVACRDLEETARWFAALYRD